MCQPNRLMCCGGVRRQRDEADQVRVEDEQRERGDEREPAGGHAPVHVAADDVVLEALVDDLDERLDAVGALLHAPRDVDHRRAGQDPGGDHVEDRLVDRQEAEVDVVVELEVVLRRVARVLAVRAEDDVQQDRPAEPDADPEPDLLLGRHRDPPACADSGPRSTTEIVNSTVNAIEHDDRRGDPIAVAAREAREQDHRRDQPDAAEDRGQVQQRAAARCRGRSTPAA